MPHHRGLLQPWKHALVTLPLLVVALATVAGCSGAPQDTARAGAGAPAGPPSSPVAAPELGRCRVLTPADVARPADDTPEVPCSRKHTAQTFAVGGLPDRFRTAAYDDPDLGAWAYRRCSRAFLGFLGADESLAMRTVVSWAWFRPSEAAWDEGARWYRCDVVGGPDGAGQEDGEDTYAELPTDAKGLLLGRPDDAWLVCAEGSSVPGSVKVPCSQPHDWRAVTTIKLGEDDDAYPGDRLVEVRTRDFCNDSVGAWLGYPVTYDFGFTWFHEAEWDAGNRRSVCWARTDV